MHVPLYQIRPYIIKTDKSLSTRPLHQMDTLHMYVIGDRKPNKGRKGDYFFELTPTISRLTLLRIQKIKISHRLP